MASPDLAAVFFVEFDNSVGRTLAFQEPAGFISADRFDSIAEFLIPKPQLCGQLLMLREEDRVVLCWPMCLEDTRYARNALLFSIGFVLEPSKGSGAPERFGRVLEKASRQLEVLERESLSSGAPGWLSGDSRGVQHLLPQLLHDLRLHGRCSVAIDASNTLELSLPPPPPRPPSGCGQLGAQEHMAPVLIAEPEPAVVRGWDLSLQKLLPRLDGTHTVAGIAEAMGADLPLVRRGLETLAAGGWVRLIEPFAFSNMYACTPRLNELALSARWRQHAVDATCRAGGAAPPSFACVLKLLAAFAPQPEGHGWRTVLGVCRLLPALCQQVDMRRLVQFGALNGALRRVHSVPVAPPPCVPRANGAAYAAAAAAAVGGTTGASPLPTPPPSTVLDGHRHMDSVCCELGAPLAVAERAVLAAFPDCVWVHR